MKILLTLVLAGVALFGHVSATVGSRCTGNLAHPCLCLDHGECKAIGGTPIERDRVGNYPCPKDAGNI
jgi:hypothetical protein